MLRREPVVDAEVDISMPDGALIARTTAEFRIVSRR